MLVVNDSEQPLTLNVTLADGQTNSTGGTGFAEKGDKAKQWIAAPDLGVMQIAAKENGQSKAARVPFTLSVPKDAAPGEYLFGFIASPTAQGSSLAAKGFVVNVVQRSAVSVIVRVAGDAAPKMQIESVTSGAANEQWHLKIALRNAGNLRWNGGEGTVTLTSDVGEKTSLPSGSLTLPFRVGIVWSGDSIAYPLYATAPKPGTYKVDVALGDVTHTTTLTIQNGGLFIPTPAPQAVAAATQGSAALALAPTISPVVSDNPPTTSFDVMPYAPLLGAASVILLIGIAVGVFAYRKL